MASSIIKRQVVIYNKGLFSPPSRPGNWNNNSDENRQRLRNTFLVQHIKGEDLKNIMFKKWMKIFQVELIKRNGEYMLDITCKSPTDFRKYHDDLDEIAEKINKWGVVGSLKEKINSLKYSPYVEDDILMDISIALDVSDCRQSEFDI